MFSIAVWIFDINYGCTKHEGRTARSAEHVLNSIDTKLAENDTVGK